MIIKFIGGCLVKITTKFSQIKNGKYYLALSKDELAFIRISCEYFLYQKPAFYNPLAVWDAKTKAKRMIKKIRETLG